MLFFDNEKHVTTTTYTYTCDCGSIYRDYSESYGNHIPSGSGTIVQTITNGDSTIYHVRYTCKICKSAFVREEYS